MLLEMRLQGITIQSHRLRIKSASKVICVISHWEPPIPGQMKYFPSLCCIPPVTGRFSRQLDPLLETWVFESFFLYSGITSPHWTLRLGLIQHWPGTSAPIPAPSSCPKLRCSCWKKSWERNWKHWGEGPATQRARDSKSVWNSVI